MKLLFTICMILSFSFSVYAQDFYGGILAGFNGSQVEGDLSSGYNKLGLIGGAWVQRDVHENFYWGMELKYIQKGSRILPTKRNEYWKYVYRLNYVDLPVLVGYKYQPFYFYGGLAFSYLINKSGYNNFGEDPSVMYDNISKWELGMFAGIKVDFDKLVQQSWARNFMLETRFHYSVLSIDKAHDFFFNYWSTGQFNNVISTVLYYRIEWPEHRD